MTSINMSRVAAHGAETTMEKLYDSNDHNVIVATFKPKGIIYNLSLVYPHIYGVNEKVQY